MKQQHTLWILDFGTGEPHSMLPFYALDEMEAYFVADAIERAKCIKYASLTAHPEGRGDFPGQLAIPAKWFTWELWEQAALKLVQEAYSTATPVK